LSANQKTLTISRENVGEFTLDGYDYDKGSVAKVSNEDSVNTAFAKLQNSLDDEVSNRKAAIEALDMTANESTTQFITKIEEVNGIISVTRADGGTLVLGPYSKATTAQDINATDSIK
jgi:hypothetical protein